MPFEENSPLTEQETDSSGSRDQWGVAVILLAAISGTVIISGMAVVTFILFFQERPIEERPFFPFERSLSLSLSLVSDIDSELASMAETEGRSALPREVVVRNESGQRIALLELVGLLGRSVPTDLERHWEGAHLGVHRGERFVLVRLNTIAFPLVVEYDNDLLAATGDLTGSDGPFRDREVMRRSNTRITTLDGALTYGFLDDRTVAVTESTEVFLDLLEIYRERL